jgi:hypothetical protein
MKRLEEIIKQKTLKDTPQMINEISSMVSQAHDPIELSEETIVQALELDGEFLLLKAHYNDFDKELQEEKIKYKISQSLSIVVSYEDDGSAYESIKKFLHYMHQFVDAKQSFLFGIKQVQTLSEFPVKILFSGILPINQLKMSVGKGIYNLIHSDDAYFLPRFQQLRDDISQEIKIPILPLFPLLDENLQEYQVVLIDPLDNRIVSDFSIPQAPDKNTLEIYLLKLFYIYVKLAKK